MNVLNESWNSLTVLQKSHIYCSFAVWSWKLGHLVRLVRQKSGDSKRNLHTHLGSFFLPSSMLCRDDQTHSSRSCSTKSLSQWVHLSWTICSYMQGRHRKFVYTTGWSWPARSAYLMTSRPTDTHVAASRCRSCSNLCKGLTSDFWIFFTPKVYSGEPPHFNIR